MNILLVIGFILLMGMFFFLIYSACVVAGRADEVILREYSHNRITNSPENGLKVDFNFSQAASAEQQGING